jgi:hypothetical protein
VHGLGSHADFDRISTMVVVVVVSLHHNQTTISTTTAVGSIIKFVLYQPHTHTHTHHYDDDMLRRHAATTCCDYLIFMMQLTDPCNVNNSGDIADQNTNIIVIFIQYQMPSSSTNACTLLIDSYECCYCVRVVVASHSL